MCESRTDTNEPGEYIAHNYGTCTHGACLCLRGQQGGPRPWDYYGERSCPYWQPIKVDSWRQLDEVVRAMYLGES